MGYAIDQLPGSREVGDALKSDTTLLKRYRALRLVLSYAWEDWPFVESVARALRVYLPQQSAYQIDVGGKRLALPNVFCYTLQGSPFQWVPGNGDHADEGSRWDTESIATGGYDQVLAKSNVFLLFAYKGLIKAGPPHVAGVGRWQRTELNNWLHVNAGNSERVQFCADFGAAHDRLNRKAPEWESVYAVSSNPGFVPLSVPAYDESSALRVAEQVLRWLLFGQDPLQPVAACPLFSYEKMIVQMYQEIPAIVSEWLAEPEAAERLDRMSSLLAFIRQGLPAFWPSVSRQHDFTATRANDLIGSGQIGTPRTGVDFLWPTDFPDEIPRGRKPDMVVAAALSKYHGEGRCQGCLLEDRLAFPEAGPRSTIYHTPPGNVAILVAGGIAPGISAVIDGIVRRHGSYSPTTVVCGIHHGFFGLSNWNTEFVERLSVADISPVVTQGGSYLKTCRLAALLPGQDEPALDARRKTLDAMVTTLIRENIRVLYAIGGDGTMRAAHELAQHCRQRDARTSVVAIPKTMDNDVLWVWQSFGFATAVEKARETIEHLATEVASNPRVCVLQLFGSASGFVVSHAVLASRSNTCDFALIPEARFSVDGLAWRFAEKVASEGRIIPYGMIVMAESAIPIDSDQYKERVDLTAKEKTALATFVEYRKANYGRFPDGQVNDDLRSAGLKLVSRGLHIRMKEIFTDPALRLRLRDRVGPRLASVDLPHVFVDDERFRVFTNEPRHILRSVPPSFADVIMGNRLGALAVDNAMAGYTDFMISQWLTEFVMIPLELVALGRKHIPEEGIFWKSVLAKTGQQDLTQA